MSGLDLEFHGLEGAHALYAWLRVGKGHLPKLCLQKEPRSFQVIPSPFPDESGRPRVDGNDLVDKRQEGCVMPTDEVIRPDAMNDLEVLTGVRLRDEPFRVTAQDAHAWRNQLLRRHGFLWNVPSPMDIALQFNPTACCAAW